MEVIIVVIYRSPSLSYNDNTKMINCLDTFVRKYNKSHELIIVGDFNLPDLSWNDGLIKCPTDTVNQNFLIQQIFLDFFLEHDLYWALDDSVVTRRRKVLNTVQQSTLDNILFTDKSMFKNVNPVSNLGASDHVAFVFNIAISNDANYITTEKRNWNKFSDNDIIYYGENVDWKFSEPLKFYTVESMWTEFYQKLQSILDKVPILKTSISSVGNVKTKSPWERSSLIRARKSKDHLWAIFDEYPTSKNLNIALKKQNDFDKMMTKCIIGYEHKLTNGLKHNPKPFYS